MTTIVIYHAHCADGNAAAWAAHRRYPDATLIAADHQDLPPEVTGADVYILDYTYDRETLLAMKAKAKSLLVIDHHEQNEKKLAGLDFCVFDMERSGAGLAWDYFFPETPRPFFINYIEDRDIWRWALPDSPEICGGLSSYPRDFTSLDYLLQQEATNLDGILAELKRVGKPIVDYKKVLIQGLVDQSHEVEFEGHKVLVCNTATLQSELGSFLCKDRPFSVTWFKNAKGQYVYSLRSRGPRTTCFDVGALATKYGGGGHRSASGFRLDHLLF